MRCNGCGASKVKNNHCAYCGNPSANYNRDIKYIDVSNLSQKAAAQLVKDFTRALEGKAVAMPFSGRPLSDMMWNLETPTPGKLYRR